MGKRKPKAVEWDLVEEGSGAVDDLKCPPPHSRDLVAIERQVTASYKGKKVILVVREIVAPEKFLAEIKGFVPPAKKFRDLTVGEEVFINRKEITGI